MLSKKYLLSENLANENIIKNMLLTPLKKMSIPFEKIMPIYFEKIMSIPFNFTIFKISPYGGFIINQNFYTQNVRNPRVIPLRVSWTSLQIKNKQ